MVKPFFMFLTLLVSTATSAQTEFRISSRDSNILINGTSSLHDWQCRAEQISGQLQADLEGSNVKAITSLTITLVVTSIKSIKDGEYYEKSMDKNVYKALNADKYPNLSFTLRKINAIRPSGKQSIIEASGVLRIAGTNKEIELTVTATPFSGGIIFEGKMPIKMTDYKVEPPTALFGTIKTGNEVKVEFKTVFAPLK